MALTKQQFDDLIKKGLTPDQITRFASGAKPVMQEPSKSVGGFLGNVAKSAGSAIGSTVDAIAHPVQTAKAIGSVALGGVQKFIPGEQGSEQAFNNVVDFYKERYGGIDNAKDTIYNDPVGFLMDIATVLGGAGGAISKAGKISGISEAVSTGSKISSVATKLDPIAQITKLRGGNRLEQAGESIYQSALKPSKAVLEDFPDVVKTGIKEGITVGKDGLDKVRDIMDDIDNQIIESIANAKAANRKVNLESVASNLERTRSFFEDVPGARKYTKQIDSMRKELLSKGDSIPVDRAQKMKKNIQTLLRKSFGELGTANTEAMKDIAFGLREEIAKVVPEIGALNARQRQLIGLDKALERFVGRYGNRDLIGLGTEVAATAGAAAYGAKGLLVGLAKAALDNPTIKSYLGRAIYTVGKNMPKTGGITKATPIVRVTQPSREQ